MLRPKAGARSSSAARGQAEAGADPAGDGLDPRVVEREVVGHELPIERPCALTERELRERGRERAERQASAEVCRTDRVVDLERGRDQTDEQGREVGERIDRK